MFQNHNTSDFVLAWFVTFAVVSKCALGVGGTLGAVGVGGTLLISSFTSCLIS